VLSNYLNSGKDRVGCAAMREKISDIHLNQQIPGH
jgi:hypothetical protein